MALYLVRHGQTDWNRERRFQARTDIALNAVGIEQAQRLRAALEHRPIVFAAARCSPLQRARETLAIVLAGSEVPWHADPRLREIDLGDFEGRREEDLRVELGTAFDEWRSARFHNAAPNGESLADAIARLAPALGPLREVTGDVLIVAHQGINLAIKAWLSGRRDRETLDSYVQANHEVDVWDPCLGHRIECFSTEDA